MKIHPLAAALAIALTLTACGGGGSSNTRPEPPPATNPPPPPPPPPPEVCEDPDARNTGEEGACIPRYRGVQDNILVPANVDRAHEAGFTGKGVKIGLLDYAPNTDHHTYAAVEGAYEDVGNFLPTGQEPGPARDHGNAMGMVMAGRPVGSFQGGAAPDATIAWATYCGGVQGACGPQRFALAYEALADAGATILNHSMGMGSALDGPGFWGPNDIDYNFLPVIERDLLAVWSGGNQVSEQVGLTAGVPYTDAAYRWNWLAVIGVDIDSDGNPTTPTAAQCGVSADWCIAAPWQYPATNNGSLTGSSPAAAFVSGVAALVQEAYPWMGGANLQTTLLTTATDMGEAGVDAVYGWGFVNADKAVRGPAQFLNEFRADVGMSGTWDFANDISGEGGLTKTGVGNLHLTGSNTYAGLTRVDEGGLFLSGSIAGDVTNNATFRVLGGSVGGDYTASSDADTQIRVGTPFQVGGTATLAGNLSLLAPASDYEVQESETILTAAALTGEFDSVTAGSGFFYSAELDYTANSIIANLTRTSAAVQATAMMAGQAVVTGAERFDDLREAVDQGTVPGGIQSGMNLLLGSQSAEAAATGLASLAGEVQGTVRVLGIQQAIGDAAAIADRTANLPHAQNGAAGWVEVFGRRGTLENGDFADADMRGAGTMAGIDTDLGDMARVGVALSASRMRGTLTDLGGEFTGRRTGLSVYGRQSFDQGYLSGVFGYDRLRVATDRGILLDNQVERVSADRRDTLVHGRVEGGWEFVEGFAPFVAVGTLQHRQGAFAENGAFGLGLTAEANTHRYTYGEAGVRFQYEAANGGRFNALLAGRWSIAGDEPEFQARFTGADGVSFIASGQSMPGTTGRASIGYTTPLSRRVELFTEGSAEFTRDGVRDGRVGVGVRVGF